MLGVSGEVGWWFAMLEIKVSQAEKWKASVEVCGALAFFSSHVTSR
jgi:hypothetical protein